MVGWVFGPPRGIPASPWGPAGAIVIVLVTTVIAAALAFLMTAALIAVTPAFRAAAVLAGFSLFQFFMVAGLIAACWLRRSATVGNSLLLRSPQWRLWQYALFALLTVGTLIVLQKILFYLTAQFTGAPVDPMSDMEQIKEIFSLDDPATVVLMVLLAVVLAPLAEEFMFRGMLFAAFQKTRLGVFGSAILLSALWSVMHWGYSSQNLVALFCLGLLFAYIVWRTGSLWPAVVGHGAINLVAVATLMGLQS